MTRLLAFLIALAVSPVLAEKITPERITALPAAEQAAWKTYLNRSQTNAAADAAALQAELIAKKWTNAVRAPSGGDFNLPAKMDDIYYGRAEAKQLADTLLSFQTPTGGWSKHTDYGKGPRRTGIQWTSQNEPGQKAHYVATFDNHATTEELYFLAAVGNATKREDCKVAFIKGLNFILAAQFPNGGWPQVYPLEGAYHDDITFNDDAMTRILELLHAIKQNEPYYAFLSESQRRQAIAALEAGLRCVLQAQIIQDGKKTAWCAQYDALAIQPAAARTMEPATLSGLESAHLLHFLMTITNPTPEIVAAIEGGLSWLERTKISGLTKSKLDGKTVYASNPDSTEVYWSRFYNLTNNQPVFPGRDGIVYSTYAEMAARNQVGYDYMTTLPGSILNNGQKKWRKMLAGSKKK